MTPKNTGPTTAAALAEAFAALAVEGTPVTVRTLRERAQVSTDAAAQWLRTNRPATTTPQVPAETLSRVFEPLWAAAIAAARDELAEATAVDRVTLVQAEADALAAAADATGRAEAAEAQNTQLRQELDALTERLATAETARDDHAARTATATAEADAARAAAHTAQLAATEAQATARTLREILDTLNTKPTAGA